MNKSEHFKLINKFDWLSYNSPSYKVIDNNTLEKEFNNFWEKMYEKKGGNSYISIMFKIKFPNGDIRSASHLLHTAITNKSKEELFTKFSFLFDREFIWITLSEFPDEETFTDDGLPKGEVIFNFKYRKDASLIKEISDKNERYEQNLEREEKFEEVISNTNNLIVGKMKFKQIHIPLSMNLNEWVGIKRDDNTAIATYEMEDGQNIIFNFNLKYCKNEIKEYECIVMKNNVKLFKFSDYKISSNSHFKRVLCENIGNIKNEQVTKYEFENGKILLYEKYLKCDFISPLKEQIYRKPLFLTLDLETKDIKGINEKGREVEYKIPTCISLYDGKGIHSKVFMDDKKWMSEICEFLNENLFLRKYDNYKVYVHNFSKFDSVFLIDLLSSIVRMGNIIQRKGKFIKFPLYYTPKKGKSKKEYHITFFDSINILPMSLKNLCKGFNVKNKKLIFPVLFKNHNSVKSILQYEGEVPELEYFKNVTESEYKEYLNKYSNKKWIYSEELIKYCEVDTLSLYEVIYKFSENIYKLFEINIMKNPTLSSIAFTAYRTKFMKRNWIPKITGKLYYALKQSFYGGITEVYRIKGVFINSYDINSLYPSSMLHYYFPSGNPLYFKGEKELNDCFGFVKVMVTCPVDIDKPTLPFKINTGNGQRTIFPSGTWTSWYFTEELKDKVQDGYKFKIEEGYLFNKRIKIFRDYINTLYKIKSESDPSSPTYLIAKLLMNSLYGRFGLTPEFWNYEILNSEEELNKILKDFAKVRIENLNYSKNIIATYDISSRFNNDKKEDNKQNISVIISAAIAAYARVDFSHYIRKYGDYLYAVDTDSVKLGVKLDKSEIDSKKLGKMKYEFTFKEGYFPLPKVYGGILADPVPSKFKSKEMVKFKGLKQSVSLYKIRQLIFSETLLFLEERWFKEIKNSRIKVSTNLFKIKLNCNKRVNVYNSLGEVIYTKPYLLENGKIVEKKYPVIQLLSPPSSVY